MLSPADHTKTKSKSKRTKQKPFLCIYCSGKDETTSHLWPDASIVIMDVSALSLRCGVFMADELQWHPTAFFTGSRGKTDNTAISYLTLTYDLWPVWPNLAIHGDHQVILCICCHLQYLEGPATARINTYITSRKSECWLMHTGNISTIERCFSPCHQSIRHKQHRCC